MVPEPDQLSQAADILNSAERVAMLVGAGAIGAGPEVAETAELLGAGVAKALLGKSVLPDDLPIRHGLDRPTGHAAESFELMQGCDTLLMVGSSFPYSEFLPEPGSARGIQIDLDGRMIGIRYAMDVQLIGDSRATLRQLIPPAEREE